MMNKEQLHTYLSLCAECYDLDKPEAPGNVFQFYLEYAREANGLILEPMCGTGRFYIPMLEQRFQIEGFDASTFMLNRLRKKCDTKKLNPSVCHDWIEKMEQQNKYCLIFIPASSLNLIIEQEKVKRCIKKIYNALQTGGKFLFEAETLKATSEQVGIWKGSVQQYLDGRKILLSTLDLPPKDNVCTTLCRYDLIDQNSIIKTEIENFQVRLHDPSQLSFTLKEIGFKAVKLLKAFDRNKDPGPNDNVIVYECQK